MLLAELMFARKLNPCSTRYYQNRRCEHQGISLLMNILTQEKKYSSICTKKEKNFYRVFECRTNPEKYILQRESAQKGMCYVEEFTNSNLCFEHGSLANKHKC